MEMLHEFLVAIDHLYQYVKFENSLGVIIVVHIFSRRNCNPSVY